MKKFFIILISISTLFISCRAPAASEKVILLDRLPTDTSFGYLYLSDESSFASQVKIDHMIYYIDSTFDLKNSTVDIPANSILQFGDQGKVVNGNLNFNGTYLDGKVKFENCSFTGNLINKTITLSWFGPGTNSTQEASQKTNSKLLREVFSIAGETLIVDGYYPLGEKIVLGRQITLKGKDWTESCHSKTYNTSYTPQYGFYTASATSIIEFTDGGGLDVYGIKFVGKKDYSVLTGGIILPLKGSLGACYNCHFEGFTWGIRAVGGFLEKIQNVSFTDNRYGLSLIYTSDFDIFGCKFTNSNSSINIPYTDSPTDANYISLQESGAGIYLSASGMVNMQDNLFDGNIINIILSQADIIINIQDNEFKNPAFCDILLYNKFFLGNSNGLIMGIGRNEVQPVSLDNIVITHNTFTKTFSPAAMCTVFVKEDSNRGTNFIFSENTFTDSNITAADTNAIFGIQNTSDSTGTVICSKNVFTKSQARAFCHSLNNASGKFVFSIDNSNTYGSNFAKNSTTNDTNSVITYQ
ncbi:MAG: hypothetical protein J6Y36_01940 [Treponema sp.]|nr:hypothetical protein [Treponema sp.]